MNLKFSFYILMECKIPLRNKFKEIVDYCIVSSEDFDILNKYFGEFGNLNF
jgi:hypothetical protein